ncbi:MAG: UDP-N-acetylmuramate dehydrogenase [Clostridia bacterium]|nr:UDP-N-acetylmuramate dehydrogenase [Clostridia bacterium]
MTNFDTLAARLAEIANLEICRNLPLAQYTTFRIGGPAALALFPRTAHAAQAALDTVCAAGVPYTVIGNGSNLLCADAGFTGAVLFTGKMKQFFFDGCTLTADSGASLTALALEAQRRGLDGLAFAYGIPGSVGGALRMNAGAYGGEMSGVVTSSLCYDSAAHTLKTVTDHAFAYRHSIYNDCPAAVALSVTMTLTPGDSADILARMQDYMQRRRDKQPLELPSAGSVFKRPVGYFAGKLIEDCGLKGTAIGGAQVSEKHAGFIVNRGGATADDVLRLIDHIRATVLHEYGVELECELVRLG